ncbi:hypothetical protein Tco_0093761 [Tanacetum coccineum]
MRKSMEDLLESLQAVETLQWENILTVGRSSNSGNHSTNSGNPLAFYFQQKPRVRDSNDFKQHMLLAKQDEAGINLDGEIQELNASCIMMARIQAVANDSDAEPSYDSDFVDEVQDCSSSFLQGLFSKNDHDLSHRE